MLDLWLQIGRFSLPYLSRAQAISYKKQRIVWRRHGERHLKRDFFRKLLTLEFAWGFFNAQRFNYYCESNLTILSNYFARGLIKSERYNPSSRLLLKNFYYLLIIFQLSNVLFFPPLSHKTDYWNKKLISTTNPLFLQLYSNYICISL